MNSGTRSGLSMYPNHLVHRPQKARRDIELRVLRAPRRYSVGDAQHRRIVLEGLCNPGYEYCSPAPLDAPLHRAYADALPGGHPRVRVRQRHGITVVAQSWIIGHALASQGVVHPAHRECRYPLDALLLLQDSGQSLSLHQCSIRSPLKVEMESSRSHRIIAGEPNVLCQATQRMLLPAPMLEWTVQEAPMATQIPGQKTVVYPETERYAIARRCHISRPSSERLWVPSRPTLVTALMSM